MEYKKLTIKEIIDDARAHGRVEELKAINASPKTKTFVDLRRAYCQQFYPELLPKRQSAKAKTFRELIEEL